jgi:hypothetical protein
MQNNKKEVSLESYLERLQSNKFVSDPRDDYIRVQEFNKETGLYDNMNLAVRGLNAEELDTLLLSSGLVKSNSEYCGSPGVYSVNAAAQGCYARINIWARKTGSVSDQLENSRYDAFPRFHLYDQTRKLTLEERKQVRWQEPAVKFVKDVLCLLKDKKIPFGLETYDSIVRYEP